MNFATNAPRGLSSSTAISSATSSEATSFAVEVFTLTNSAGITRDIRHIVKEFVIEEDLFSPVVTLNATFRDDVNFFTTFGLNGNNESVSLRIRKPGGGLPLVLTNLRVLEYPSFAEEEASLGVVYWSLTAVSSFAYASRMKKISRAISGNPLQAIHTILTKDCAFPAESIDMRYPTVSNFETIISTRPPLAAVASLLSRTFTSTGSPYYAHSDLRGIVHFSPLESLISAPPLSGTYTSDKGSILSTTSTPESHTEKRYRISSLSSTRFGANRLNQINGGGGRINFLDVGSKTYYTQSGSPAAGTDPRVVETVVNPSSAGRGRTPATSSAYSTATLTAETARAAIAAAPSVTIELPGDPAHSSGVRLTLATPSSATWLITHSRHIFNSGTHTSVLTLSQTS